MEKAIRLTTVISVASKSTVKPQHKEHRVTAALANVNRGQTLREFAAKLAQCYPGLTATYVPSPNPFVPSYVRLSRRSATWTHRLHLLVGFDSNKISFVESAYLTDRPYGMVRERDSETVDNVNDMHRVIRSYFS